MKKSNNRGFTLVELLICLTIFGIVMMAVFGFMFAGANTYNTVNDRLELQLDAQIASSQISEFITDCNGRIGFKNNTLYISNSTAIADEFQTFALTNGEINLSSKTDGSDPKLLIQGVTAFSVELFGTDGAPAFQIPTTIGSAKLTIRLKLRDAVFTTEKIIALRNKPAYYIP